MDTLKTWMTEINNPSTPAQYTLTHKLKYLTKVPDFPCTWSRQDFLRYEQL